MSNDLPKLDRISEFINDLESGEKHEFMQSLKSQESKIVQKGDEFLATFRSDFELDSCFHITLFVYGPLSMGIRIQPPDVSEVVRGFCHRIQVLGGLADNIFYKYASPLKRLRHMHHYCEMKNDHNGMMKHQADIDALVSEMDMMYSSFVDKQEDARLEGITLGDDDFKVYWVDALDNRRAAIKRCSPPTREELKLICEYWGEYPLGDIPYCTEPESAWPVEDPIAELGDELLPSGMLILSPTYDPRTEPAPLIYLP